ncbi:MAG: hypothetical protein PHQ43_02740 [Dehalococcoidales bacterium]|nr:hypothetical protein [Dehalococcoidales bacterium]
MISAEHIIIAALIVSSLVREVIHRWHLHDLEEKLFAGSPERYRQLKEKEPQTNQATNTGSEENPNEIEIDESRPFPFPKEFNLEVEGEDKPRAIKLEGEM